MYTTTVLYIIIALLLSISVAYFQYFYKEKNKSRIYILLFSLKTFSLFLLLLLLINPSIRTKKIEQVKPKLTILIDNSKSLSFFKEEETLNHFYEKIKKDKRLNEKFEIEEFSFGKEVYHIDSLSFKESETNISKAILSVNQLNDNKIAPIVLLTDGNQTIGNDYEFVSSKQFIYPIVFGDTITYKDLKITQLNTNKYSYIKNKFPVEVLLNYEGKEAVVANLSIAKAGKIVFSKKVQFSPQEKSKTIRTNLASDKEGLQYYTATIQKIAGEKNTKNNIKNFPVEIINEQTKILILTAVLHPDLGVLKRAIETNKQRSVEIALIDTFKSKLSDYNLVILNNVNKKFTTILDAIERNKSNYFLVTGKSTDWNFINKRGLGIHKKAIDETESYNAIFNDSYLTFHQKDIGFNEFDPLKDKYGEVTISKAHQVLLYQQIRGVETTMPLLITFNQNNQKSGALLGEGIWKWRATSYLKTNSFQDFDEFISNLIQYLASNKKRSRLSINAARLYPANSTIQIAAFYTDENYQFDTRANLEIRLTNTESKKVTTLPFSLAENSYQVEIENLPSGTYAYRVIVDGQNISKKGRFKVTDYQIEEQFTNANDTKLQKLADKTGGKLFYNNQQKVLIDELVDNPAYYTLQKSIIKNRELINWKWILFFIISLLTIEWFVRKYHGKI